jgi:predicted ABC-type transport system involved in lysophospholipase L1 biosynthesis ATPase subunit
MSNPVITLRRVTKTFGSGRGAVTALHDVDVEVEDGEFVCLIGASGSMTRARAPWTSTAARRSCSRRRRCSRG